MKYIFLSLTSWSSAKKSIKSQLSFWETTVTLHSSFQNCCSSVDHLVKASFYVVPKSDPSLKNRGHLIFGNSRIELHSLNDTVLKSCFLARALAVKFFTVTAKNRCSCWLLYDLHVCCCMPNRYLVKPWRIIVLSKMHTHTHTSVSHIHTHTPSFTHVLCSFLSWWSFWNSCSFRSICGSKFIQSLYFAPSD